MSTITELFDLTGRKAIITGGSRGLGLQIAEALGSQGAELVLTARKAAELESAVDRLAAQGIAAHAIASDQSQPDQIAAFADAALERLGHVDILVNNAGATWGAPAEDHPLDAWMKVVNLNLTGVFLLTQAIGKRSMIPRRYGRILTVASIAGLRGNPPGMQQTLAYNTTKGGLVNFTRTLAGEWGVHGITVNALAPGGNLTVEMKTTFVRPATGRLTATGRSLHAGRSLTFCEGEITNDGGETVARASGTFKYWNAR